jgi:branched-chain amino acid transport system permease protein
MMSKSVKSTAVGLVLLVLLLLPYLGVNAYTLHLVALSGIYAIIVMGLNMIFGYTGQISLGHAAYFAIGAYTSAILTAYLGFPFSVAIICAGLASLAFGIVVGIPSLKLEGSYLAMATIGFSEIVRMILVNWTKLSGGPAGISGIPDPSFFGLVLHTVYQKYYLIVGVAAVAFICYRKLVRSHYGTQFVAVRESAIAAQAMGVNASGIKLLAFGLSTLYAGIAGSLYAHLNRYVAPDGFHVQESITLLLMVVLGGRGSVLGPILGAFVLVEARESLRMLKDYNMLVYGFAIMVFMIYLPNGVMGVNLRDLWQKITGKSGVQPGLGER